MSELNNAINSQIISRHLKLDVERTNLEEVLREVALKLTEYENKVMDLEHALDLKEKALSRQLGLT
jgi:hypothetical protein